MTRKICFISEGRVATCINPEGDCENCEKHADVEEASYRAWEEVDKK